MGLGFIHGVMNTDNMAISGETIDYGPCAFMEGYAPETVFSSIDHQGTLRLSKPAADPWLEPCAAGRNAGAVLDGDQNTAVDLANDRLAASPRVTARNGWGDAPQARPDRHG